MKSVRLGQTLPGRTLTSSWGCLGLLSMLLRARVHSLALPPARGGMFLQGAVHLLLEEFPEGPPDAKLPGFWLPVW